MQERPTFRNRRLDIMAGRKFEADKATSVDPTKRQQHQQRQKTLADCFKEIFGYQPSEEFLD